MRLPASLLTSAVVLVTLTRAAPIRAAILNESDRIEARGFAVNAFEALGDAANSSRALDGALGKQVIETAPFHLMRSSASKDTTSRRVQGQLHEVTAGASPDIFTTRSRRGRRPTPWKNDAEMREIWESLKDTPNAAAQYAMIKYRNKRKMPGNEAAFEAHLLTDKLRKRRPSGESSGPPPRDSQDAAPADVNVSLRTSSSAVSTPDPKAYFQPSQKKQRRFGIDGPQGDSFGNTDTPGEAGGSGLDLTLRLGLPSAHYLKHRDV